MAAQGRGEAARPAAPGVLVRLLGEVGVTVHGRPVDLGPRRHRELLAALAVDAGTLVALPTIVQRVWGEDAEVSSTSVHALVSRLRASLRTAGAAEVVLTAPPGYRLDTDHCVVDADELARLVARARRTLAEGDPVRAREAVAEALALWRGSPLADVRGDFAVREAARLEERRLTAVELAAELDLVLGRHEQLLDELPALVRAHPLREPLRAAHVIALYRAGRQAEALASYEAGRAALAEELGVDPGRSMRELHHRVLNHDPELDWRPWDGGTSGPEVPTAAPRRAADPTLVGRRDEVDRVLGAVRAGLATTEGRPALVALTGEPGVGKTTVVEAVTRQLGADVLVARGQASEHAGAPALWPWEQALTDVVAAVGPEVATAAARGRAAPVALLVPEARAGGGPWGAAVPTSARLFDAVVAFLAAVASDRPVLVVLEDLQWSDADSVALLAWWAATARTGRLAVVVTLRDPSDEPATVEAVRAALSRAPGVEVVPVAGLGPGEVAELVARRLGQPVGAEVAAALHERTDGNPFYLVELVRLLAQERSAGGRADVPVPSGVRAVVERRLAHLPAADRDLLAAGAVLGRTFAAVDAAAVVGRPLASCAASVDRAAAVGLLEPAGGDEQRFVHALVQEALVAGLGPMQRAALHASAGEVLEARHEGDLDPVAAALAHHFGEAGPAGDPERAVRYALRAASVAEARAAYAEAERLLHRALAGLPALPAGLAAVLELDARVRLGSLLSQRLGYNHPRVVELREQAAALTATGVGGDDDHAHLTSALWGVWGNALVSGDVVAADRLSSDLGDAAARTGSPRLALAHAQSVGQVRWHQGRLAEARASLERAVALADGDTALRADLYIQHPAVAVRGWLAVTLAQAGEVGAADEVGDDATARAEALDHPFTLVYLDILEAWRAVWLERPEEAAARAGRAVRTAAEHGFSQLETFALPPQGWARGRRGDHREGAAEVGAALAAFAALPSGYMFGPVMHGALADLRLHAGDPAAALASARTARTLAVRAGDVGHLAEHLRCEARALAAAGERDAAREATRRALAVAESQGAGLFAGRARDLLASLG